MRLPRAEQCRQVITDEGTSLKAVKRDNYCGLAAWDYCWVHGRYICSVHHWARHGLCYVEDQR